MNIKEIAKLAGVSASTVSKVMNNKAENIAPETKARILKVAKEYNYVPYSSIRNAAPVRTYLLGVLLRDFIETGKLIQGALKAAAENGYSLLLYDCSRSSESELKYISALCRHNVDGVLWDPVDSSDLDNKRHFDKADIPITFINSPLKEAINIDVRRIAYMCTEKLIENKHHNINCLIDYSASIADEVEKGFKDCLFDYQIVFHSSMITSVDRDEPLGDEIPLKATGFVCSEYALAVNLLDHLHKLNYDVPYDYSIISLEQDIRDAAGGVDFTTYAIPYQQFGYAALTSLIDKIESRSGKAVAPALQEFVFGPGATVDIARDYRNDRILCCGGINMDSYFIVDELKPAGEITPIKHLTAAVGGRGCNMAIGCTRLGHEAILIGKVGSDTEANEILDALNSSGVITEGITRAASSDSGKAFIYSPSDGSSAYTVLDGANASLTAEDIHNSKNLFKNVSYCLISAQLPQEAVLACAKLAKKAGAKTILKPAAIPTLSDELAKLTDYLIPDQEEAKHLVPKAKTPEGQANALLKKGVGAVIITGKEHGSYLFTKSTKKHYDAINLAITDRSGGSDAFISAFASFMNEGYDTDRSIRLAQYATAFCISLQGVYSALVDRNTLMTYIEKNEPELLVK